MTIIRLTLSQLPWLVEFEYSHLNHECHSRTFHFDERHFFVKHAVSSIVWSRPHRFCFQICTHIVTEYQNENGRVPSCTTDKAALVTPSPKANLYADVLAAKQDGKYLVHPRWLTACLATSRRLPESDFAPGTISYASPSACPRPEDNSPAAEPACKIPRTGRPINIIWRKNYVQILQATCTNWINAV